MILSFQTLIAIGSGGFLGAVSRAYINELISHKVPHTLPFGTLGVNLIGSLLLGILIAFFMNTTLFSEHTKSFLSTGFLGALTTYSTFALESFFLLQGGHIALGITNMLLNLLGTVIFAGVGFTLFNYFLK